MPAKKCSGALAAFFIPFVFAFATACSSSTVLVHELVPNATRAPRSPDTVEIFLNGRPARTFTSLYLIDIREKAYDDDQLVRYRERAARLGCDAVVVYNAKHPAIVAGPRHEDEMLVLTKEGGLASRADGSTVPNRKAVAVHTASKTLIVESPSMALCIVYGPPPA